MQDEAKAAVEAHPGFDDIFEYEGDAERIVQHQGADPNAGGCVIWYAGEASCVPTGTLWLRGDIGIGSRMGSSGALGTAQHMDQGLWGIGGTAGRRGNQGVMVEQMSENLVLEPRQGLEEGPT